MDFVKQVTKKKWEARNKIYRDTNLIGKHKGDKYKKPALSVTLIHGLSKNHTQTRTS